MINNQIVKMINLIEKQEICYTNINKYFNKKSINHFTYEKCTDLIQINTYEFNKIKKYQKEIESLQEQIVSKLNLKEFSIDQLALYVNDKIIELLKNKISNLCTLINKMEKSQRLLINKIKELKVEAKNSLYKMKKESKLLNTYNNTKRIDSIFIDRVCK